MFLVLDYINTTFFVISASSIVAGILVPLFFIAMAALVVLGRRYGWWERLRQPRVRQYDTALVGGDLDDDPPIS